MYCLEIFRDDKRVDQPKNVSSFHSSQIFLVVSAGKNHTEANVVETFVAFSMKNCNVALVRYLQ